jgi:hypothetical protein
MKKTQLIIDVTASALVVIAFVSAVVKQDCALMIAWGTCFAWVLRFWIEQITINKK